MTDTEIDVIYTLIDGLENAGLFNLIDEVLELEPKFMDIDMVLSILTVTYPARHKLNNRKAFYDKCSLCITYSLLRGLE